MTMRWPIAITLTATLLLGSIVVVTSRIILERRKHYTTLASLLSHVFSVLALSCFLVSFACAALRGHQRIRSNRQPHADNELWSKPLDIPTGVLQGVLKLVVLELIMVPTAVWLAKASVLATIYSFANRVTKRQLWGMRALVGVVGLCYLCVMFSHVFVCTPFRSQWSLDPSEFCSPVLRNREQVISTSLDLLCNTLIICYCIWTFKPSSMPAPDRRVVAVLVALFATGSLAGLSRVLIILTDPIMFMEPDTLNLVAFLSRMQLALGLIACCWPSLRGIIDTTLFTFDATMGGEAATEFAKVTRKRMMRKCDGKKKVMSTTATSTTISEAGGGGGGARDVRVSFELDVNSMVISKIEGS